MPDSNGRGTDHPIRAGYREGLEASKIGSRWDAVLRATVLAVALVAAWWIPWAWYWKMAIFVAIMFSAGIIVPVMRKRN